MVEPQGLYTGQSVVDLRINESSYFGAPLREIDAVSRDGWGLRERPTTDIYRVSYVYQKIIQVRDHYGGIQVRGRTFLHLENGNVPIKIQRHVQRAAHRAAEIFDSAVEESIYQGYLTGFGGEEGVDYWENQPKDGTGDPDDLNYQNWEVEKVTGTDAGAAGLGAIDFSLEIYQEEADGSGFTGFANLSGLATGTVNPWRLEQVTEPGRAPTHVPPTKWVIGWEDGRDPPEYYVRPQPGTDASTRYRDGAGAGKKVYVNEKPIGSLGPKGRVWLRPEYQRGDPNVSKGSWGTYWSREGLVDETEATYQAIRKGGALYQTGETTEAVYLTTSRAKPDGWKGADPDDVPTDLVVDEGQDAKSYKVLEVRQPEGAVPTTVEQDKEVDKHLGYSNPTYTHSMGRFWEWPGFRPVSEYGDTGGYHPDPGPGPDGGGGGGPDRSMDAGEQQGIHDYGGGGVGR